MQRSSPNSARAMLSTVSRSGLKITQQSREKIIKFVINQTIDVLVLYVNPVESVTRRFNKIRFFNLEPYRFDDLGQRFVDAFLLG